MWQKASAAAGFSLASAESTSQDSGPDHTSAIKKRKVERIPLPVPRARPRS
jgi:hypothetical protein